MSLSSFRKLGELLEHLTVSGVTSLKHKAISSQAFPGGKEGSTTNSILLEQ